MSKVENSPVNNEEVKSSKKPIFELDKKFESNNEEVFERLKEIKSNQMLLFKEQDLLIKQYKKNCDVELKKFSGKRRKKILEGGETKRSGFTKPTRIPKQIAEFLGLSEEAVLPRTEVTKHIYEYIKSNELQIKEDKKKSYTDAKLSELFNLPEKSVIEFSTFQVLLSKVYNLDKARLLALNNTETTTEVKVEPSTVVETSTSVVEISTSVVETEVKVETDTKSKKKGTK